MLFQPTRHAETRKQQRGISDADIQIAFQYGEMLWSHGCILYIITDNALRLSPWMKNASHLRGLTLVTTNEGDLITVKYNYALRGNPKVWRKKYHLN
jgi:hypothetical protein